MDLGALEAAVRKAMKETAGRPVLATLATGGVDGIGVPSEYVLAARTLAERRRSNSGWDLLRAKAERWM